MLADLAQGVLDREASGINVIGVEPVGDGSGGLVEDIALLRLRDPADAHAVAAARGLGPDQMLAQQRDAEAEHGLAALGPDEGAVHIEADLALIGVNLDLGLLLAAVDITFSAQVDKRLFFVPGGLVEIESVLAQLAIEGDKALLVLAVLAALVPPVGGEVEEVPHVGGPKVRPGLDHLEHVLVIKGLVLLGVVALLGAAAVEGGVGIGAILAEADDPFGVLGVIFVKELVGLLQLSQVPAEIEVIAVDVRDLENGALDLQHEDIRHSGQARRIHAVAEFVEGPVVFQQLLVHGAGSSDLVGEAPDGDGGVVIALGDELPHLVQGVLPSVVHVHGDVGDLGPDHDAVFVAEVIELLGVLVVGQTQGVGSQLPDDSHIGLVVLIGEGVALALQVLVAAHAPEGIAAAVEEEALFRIAAEDPAAEAGGNLVPGRELRRGGVQEGILHAVP